MIENIKEEIIKIYNEEHYEEMENAEYLLDDIFKILDKYKKKEEKLRDYIDKKALRNILSGEPVRLAGGYKEFCAILNEGSDIK